MKTFIFMATFRIGKVKYSDGTYSHAARKQLICVKNNNVFDLNTCLRVPNQRSMNGYLTHLRRYKFGVLWLINFVRYTK